MKQIPLPFHIQKCVLLSGKTRLGKILGRGTAPDRNIEPSPADIDKFMIRSKDRISRIVPESSRQDRRTDSLPDRGYPDRILDSGLIREQILDKTRDPIALHEFLKCPDRKRKSPGNTHPFFTDGVK